MHHEIILIAQKGFGNYSNLKLFAVSRNLFLLLITILYVKEQIFTTL